MGQRPPEYRVGQGSTHRGQRWAPGQPGRGQRPPGGRVGQESMQESQQWARGAPRAARNGPAGARGQGGTGEHAVRPAVGDGDAQGSQELTSSGDGEPGERAQRPAAARRAHRNASVAALRVASPSDACEAILDWAETHGGELRLSGPNANLGALADTLSWMQQFLPSCGRLLPFSRRYGRTKGGAPQTIIGVALG